MALQPATARRFSLEDPFDPAASAEAGTHLLGQLVQQFNSNVDLVLAAYNSGSEAVNKFHGVPTYRETTDYVKHVGHIYRICKAEQ